LFRCQRSNFVAAGSRRGRQRDIVGWLFRPVDAQALGAIMQYTEELGLLQVHSQRPSTYLGRGGRFILQKIMQSMHVGRPQTAQTAPTPTSSARPYTCTNTYSGTNASTYSSTHTDADARTYSGTNASTYSSTHAAT